MKVAELCLGSKQNLMEYNIERATYALHVSFDQSASRVRAILSTLVFLAGTTITLAVS